MNSEHNNTVGEHTVTRVLSASVSSLSHVSALLGGIVLYAVAVIVTVSVVLRLINVGGITGDVEIVKLGCGISAFLFLPFCQMQKGHVTVDLFSNFLPGKIQIALEALWQFIFVAAWLLLAWRMLLGGIEIYEFQDKTVLLRIPLWLIYVAAVFGSVLSALAAIHISLTPSVGSHSENKNRE